MPDTVTTQSFMASSSKAEVIMKVSFILALILNFGLASKATMDYYVAMMQTLAMIVHFPLLNVVIPANLSFFFSMLLPLVIFDVLDSIEGKWYDPVRMYKFEEE